MNKEIKKKNLIFLKVLNMFFFLRLSKLILTFYKLVKYGYILIILASLNIFVKNKENKQTKKHFELNKKKNNDSSLPHDTKSKKIKKVFMGIQI